MTPLARPHAQGRVAFDQLHVAVAVGDRVEDVLDLEILVEIDEIAALGVRQYGEGVVGARRIRVVDPLGQPVGVRQGGLGGAFAVGDTFIARHQPVHRARGDYFRRQRRDQVHGARFVISEGAAGLPDQRAVGAVADRHGDKISAPISSVWAA